MNDSAFIALLLALLATFLWAITGDAIYGAIPAVAAVIVAGLGLVNQIEVKP